MSTWLKPPPEETLYCGVCGYPLKPAPQGDCMKCYDDRLAELKRKDEWVEAIGGIRAWEDYTLAKFKAMPYNAKGLELAKAFDPVTQNLFLYGPVGSGKSHCAAIAKRGHIMAGRKVKTVLIHNVLDDIKSGIRNGQFSGLAKEWLRVFTFTPILSIEDMGVEKPSDFVLEFYFKFIDARVLRKMNGLLITSNYSINQLKNRWAEHDPEGRVASRLTQLCKGTQASFIGSPDWRQGEAA